MKSRNIWIIHLVYWLIFIFNLAGKSSFKLSEILDHFSISNFLVNLLTFYFNYYVVVPAVMKNPKPWKLLVGFLVSFFFFVFLRYGIEEIIFLEIYGSGNYFEGTTFSYYIFDNFYWGSNAVFISSLIWFLDFAFRKEKENKQLLKQKNEAEMSLLKSQINPHFIFNTLNNIYSLVNQKSDKSLTAIEKLGDLLRYSGKEMEKEKTALQNEISYIESLIELESLRLANPENIDFRKSVSDENVQIAPMILIPFVENAFKHGDLKNNQLLIEVKAEGNQLEFNQQNKIANANKDHSTGIGIENVKRRLQILYPEKHQLNIENNGEFYTVNLKIDL